MKRILFAFIGILMLSTFCFSKKTYQPAWESIDSRPVSAWFKDAKSGIFIHYIKSKNGGIIVNLAKEDLYECMEQMSPKNHFLWIATKIEEEELAIMKKVEKWSRK